MSCAPDIPAAARRGRAILYAAFAALLACSGTHQPVNGTSLLAESVALTREGLSDSAVREVTAPASAIVVAFVDEQGTDVSLTLVSGDTRREVESMRRGEGIEIAVLESPAAGGTMRIELKGPANSVQPGSVRLSVEAFSAADLARAGVATRLDAYRAFSRGTRADLTTSDIATDAAPQLQRAIAAFEARDGGDALLAARTRIVRAFMLYQFEINWREARDEARRAAAAFAAPEVGDALNAARAQRIEAQALQEMAHSGSETAEQKLACKQEARRMLTGLIAEKSPLDAIGRGRAYNDLAIMDVYEQEWDSARVNIEKGIALYRSAGYRMGEVLASRNLAQIATLRGDYSAASRAFESLLGNIELMPDDESRTTLLSNAAIANLNLGQTDLAIERLLRAKQIAESAGRAAPRTRALQSLGVAYWARGDVEQARTFFDEAFAAQKALADDPGMFNALRARGLLLRDSGDARGALEAHRAALEHAYSTIPRLRAQIEVARDYAALGDRTRALAAIRAGLKEPRKVQEHPALREAQLTLAELLVLGRSHPAAETAEAIELARAALTHALATTDLPMEITALRVLASAALERGALEEAVAHFERAITLVIKYSRGSANPELQAATRASQQQLFREYLDAQMSAAGTDAAQQRALEVLETVRALNFLLARAGTGPKDTAELDGLLGQLASRHVRLAELREREEPDSRAIEKLQLEMATLRAQIDRVRTSRADAHPAADSELRPEWKPLAPGQVQLSYSLGANHGYLWRRTAEGVEGWTLPGTAREIRSAVLAAANIDRLQRPAAYDDALLNLSAQLLPRDVVAADAADVTIVADDELSLIPFSALRSPTDPGKRFAETHVLTMVPSLLDTHEAHTAAKRRWRLVAVRGAENAQGVSTAMRGSSLFPALPGAGAEVDAVLKRFAGESQQVQVLEGDSATVAGVHSLMVDGAEVMHFATHGHADLRHPLASLLSLPKELLSAGQIQEWRGDVGLVFLSACETAVGPTRFAEGMPGLQRAFLRAGAGNVIATLWPVEDGLARQFAETFYEEFARGVTPAEALARAQRRWIPSVSGESSQKATRRRVAAWGYVLYSR